ncbi:hypothetical protein NQ315_008843 [Exocentrus adspersus]|uniref:DDE Tnp4 domain-containing protein n=1 Tax=Exocentrus adspersus TaxID=1586481 RepID=A0AAV8VCA5_9CUCU|nr:hypothetical protein NQ315_008843 [Exocentrus adspersus]
MPNSSDDWKIVQKSFETKWNFPNCCGAIDGKHVQIKRPPNSGSTFYNYKDTYTAVIIKNALSYYV